MTIDDKIAFFFAAPEQLQLGPSRSTLHLVRREIQDCLIGTVIDENRVVEVALCEPHRLFATTMVMMSGVDLLAKFYAGSDAQGQVGPRIKEFAKQFIFTGQVSADRMAEVLYLGLRNPLLHSFTLHHETLKISLTNGDPKIVVATNPADPQQFVIGIEGLYAAFVRAIDRYKTEVKTSADAQAKFAAMFPKYGSISVWSATVQPV